MCTLYTPLCKYVLLQWLNFTAMYITENTLITGAAGKPIAMDIFYTDTATAKPVVVYAHGFNGFKDWGNANIIAEQFATAGYVFVKFNFSHNGTTPEYLQDFVDLDAFGNNNYTKQLYDVNSVVNWVCDENNIHNKAINKNSIYLIGHSMGGGIAILYAAKDTRIKKLITWAGISECKTPWTNWSKEQLQHWKKTGVAYYLNGRTKQNMPIYFQLYQDYQDNEAALKIETAMRSLSIPILICHGNLDTAVAIEKAHDLHNWQPSAVLFTVESDHVFGRKHPWLLPELPKAMQAVLNETLHFIGA